MFTFVSDKVPVQILVHKHFFLGGGVFVFIVTFKNFSATLYIMINRLNGEGKHGQ